MSAVGCKHCFASSSVRGRFCQKSGTTVKSLARIKSKSCHLPIPARAGEDDPKLCYRLCCAACQHLQATAGRRDSCVGDGSPCEDAVVVVQAGHKVGPAATFP